ncbi:MAG: aspartate-semialdehyde dehydrogenase, partial [Candidatus Lightella neohaematopini]|nr:aspartate-semialdehyde dehydrogenase [Candidatus Lightella neohaematopini]
MNNKYWLSNNAYDLDLLRSLDIIINCHGSNYTSKIYYKLRFTKWNGYWLDTSSLLRMKSDSIIVLDPINLPLILHNLNNGIKNFVSGNCTVNLLLMSLGGLFINNLIDWISVATYQAVSGGGAKCMLELINQLKLLNIISNSNKLTINDLTTIEYSIRKSILYHRQPLAYNIIPWIGNKKIKEQSLEEWKSQIE